MDLLSDYDNKRGYKTIHITTCQRQHKDIGTGGTREAGHRPPVCPRPDCGATVGTQETAFVACHRRHHLPATSLHGAVFQRSHSPLQAKPFRASCMSRWRHFIFCRLDRRLRCRLLFPRKPIWQGYIRGAPAKAL